MITRTLPLRHRRLAVALQLLSYPLLSLLTSLLDLPMLAGLCAAIVVYLGASWYLYRGTGLWQFGNAPDQDLDERQVQVRNRAYRLAYAAVSALVILLAAYCLLASDLGWRIPQTDENRLALLWGGLFLLPVLPAAILAWTETDV